MNYIADRRQEEKDRRRVEILDAAESVAAAEGIDALTMDQVARRARISRALLYVYFQDKADLHLGICERALALLAERFEEARSRNVSGIDQILAIGRAYVAFSAEFPMHFEALARFQAHEAQAGEPSGAMGNCFACGDRVHQIMFAAIAAGQQDGSIDKAAGSPASIAMALAGGMHGVIQQVATKGGVLAQYGLGGRELFEQALQIMRAGLQPGRR
jgi:AcrR family transcriptional regulator